jgi:hypothetical protein
MKDNYRAAFVNRGNLHNSSKSFNHRFIEYCSSQTSPWIPGDTRIYQNNPPPKNKNKNPNNKKPQSWTSGACSPIESPIVNFLSILNKKPNQSKRHCYQCPREG